MIFTHNGQKLLELPNTTDQVKNSRYILTSMKNYFEDNDYLDEQEINRLQENFVVPIPNSFPREVSIFYLESYPFLTDNDSKICVFVYHHLSEMIELITFFEDEKLMRSFFDVYLDSLPSTELEILHLSNTARLNLCSYFITKEKLSLIPHHLQLNDEFVYLWLCHYFNIPSEEEMNYNKLVKEIVEVKYSDLPVFVCRNRRFNQTLVEVKGSVKSGHLREESLDLKFFNIYSETLGQIYRRFVRNQKFEISFTSCFEGLLTEKELISYDLEIRNNESGEVFHLSKRPTYRHLIQDVRYECKIFDSRTKREIFYLTYETKGKLFAQEGNILKYDRETNRVTFDSCYWKNDLFFNLETSSFFLEPNQRLSELNLHKLRDQFKPEYLGTHKGVDVRYSNTFPFRKVNDEIIHQERPWSQKPSLIHRSLTEEDNEIFSPENLLLKGENKIEIPFKNNDIVGGQVDVNERDEWNIEICSNMKIRMLTRRSICRSPFSASGLIFYSNSHLFTLVSGEEESRFDRDGRLVKQDWVFRDFRIVMEREFNFDGSIHNLILTRFCKMERKEKVLNLVPQEDHLSLEVEGLMVGGNTKKKLILTWYKDLFRRTEKVVYEKYDYEYNYEWYPSSPLPEGRENLCSVSIFEFGKQIHREVYDRESKLIELIDLYPFVSSGDKTYLRNPFLPLEEAVWFNGMKLTENVYYNPFWYENDLLL